MVQLAAVGNTIPVALDGAFKFNQLGIPAVAGDIWETQTAYTFNLGPEDVVMVISNSGSSKRLQTLAEGAKENGCTVILITNNGNSPSGRDMRLQDCHCHQGKAADRGVLVFQGDGYGSDGDTLPSAAGWYEGVHGAYTAS